MSKKKLVPRLRFREFDDSEKWESYKLSELSEINPRTKLPDNFRYVSLESVKNNFLVSYEITTRIDAPSRAQRLAKKGDVFFQTVRPYQKNNLLFDIIDSNYVFSSGYAQIRTHMNEKFLFYKLMENRFVEKVLARSTGTSYPAIKPDDLTEISILIPSDESEQNKIGSLFKQIDEMIQLQQSKVNKVKDIKSAYLSEMFPKEGEKYPKKRFEGFTEPWTAKKLGSLLDYEQPTNYLVKSDSYDDSYLTPVLTAGKSFLLGYTNETEGIYKADNNNGVIIFDDFTTSSHFVDFDFKVKSSAMKFLRTNQSNFNLYFLYNLLTSINYSPESHERHWISIFSEFEVLVPTKKEQEKIAQLFKNLDNQISIEEKKLAKLENLKQGYLNDMFV